MHAVFITGGKQYRVSEGDTLRVEKLNAEEGSDIDFDTVLMLSDGDDVKVGAPYVDGGKVSATVDCSWQGRQGVDHQVQAPQRLPAPQRPSAAVY